nr:flagellar biosynthetic protein FliR [Poseidonocella pacifica]
MVVFFRIGAILATLPAFGERAVPVQVRLIVALSFTLIVAPIVTPGWDIAFETPMQMLGYLIPETIVGLVMGLMLRLFVLALSVAGSIAAQSTSLSQILGGAALEPMPAIGHLLVVSGLALAVLFGLHTRITEWMVLSYDLFPPGRLPDANLISEWGVQRISRAFSLAFMLAAPFVIASLVYNLALGVINKAMPQLMVSFVGAPVVTAGGLFILFLASPIMLEVWLTALNGFIANPFGAQP